MGDGNYTFLVGNGVDNKLMPEKIDLVLTDPPFKPKTQAYQQIRKNSIHKLEPIITPIKNDWDQMMFTLLGNVYTRMNNGNIMIKLDDFSARELYSMCHQFSYNYSIIWDKNRIGLGRKYRKQHEVIEIYSKGTTFWRQRERQFVSTKWHGESQGIAFPSIIKIPNYNAGTKGATEQYHINQTPWELWGPFLYHCCPDSGTVYDPFCGSGSIARAVHFLNLNENLDIHYVGIDAISEFIEYATDHLTDHEHSLPDLSKYYRPKTQRQLTVMENGSQNCI